MQRKKNSSSRVRLSVTRRNPSSSVVRITLIMRRLVARSKISAMKYLLNCQKAGHGAEDIPVLKVWKAQSPRAIFSTIRK